MIQPQLGVQLLQAAAFLFQFLEALYSSELHAAILGFPVLVGRIGDALLQTHFLDQTIHLDLFQDINDL